ncbi:MAG: alpha-glucan family phosphorylase [Bacteroidaceae bacterium]|nr:alpha-glucan family phosphorylase [Bacteroidaceae bacterium]
MNVKVSNVNTPSWKTLTVQAKIPAGLSKLEEMSNNLWWTWNTEAYNLFRSINEQLFSEKKHNALEVLGALSYDELLALSKDKQFTQRMDTVYSQFRKYMDTKPDTTRPSVAYFCMEYGLIHFLKIYSGGLGILAGDYMKQASDSNVDMVGVGLLYRFGYFTQELAMDGTQIANYEPQDFDQLPYQKVLGQDGHQLVIGVPFPYATVYANVWKVNVGRVSLYLLDTDNPLNSEYDRNITHTLYGGDWENRMKQEYLLGIGGMQLLNQLGIKRDIYHCNEGHAALCNLYRLAAYVEQGLNFNQALELVRASSLYTVHTPVPAGHDYFDESMAMKYLGGYADRLGISWDDLVGLGRNNPDDKSERFCMSIFACKTCQEVNGVSKLHGTVSQNMFNNIWQGYFPSENHVGYVTNGVHLPTWAAREWKALYEKYFGADFYADQSNANIWEKIYEVPDEEIWQTRVKLKTKLIEYIRERFRKTWLKNQGDPSRVVSLLDKINPNALLVGFGRRFATYKRAHLLFTDLDRLRKIVNNEEYPVQFIYTGKAHPADGAGQGLIKRIYNISQSPEFLGKIIFLENYDMQLSRRLISGVDIWMNTPTRPLEASGTSGEKALMNGLLNLSVLDGWWLEGYREGAGWALTEKRTYQNQEHQDKLDASTIYNLLEREIIPLYYNRDGKEFSSKWIRCIKNSIAQIAPHYTMKRQLDDYYDKFYNRLGQRFRQLSANDNAQAKAIAAWKEHVAAKWDAIKVVTFEANHGPNAEVITSGSKHTLRVKVDTAGLEDSIGIEMVMTAIDSEGKEYVYEVAPFNIVDHEGNLTVYELVDTIDKAGSFKVAYRIYPKNDLLPHRQDFCYVKWF